MHSAKWEVKSVVGQGVSWNMYADGVQKLGNFCFKFGWKKCGLCASCLGNNGRCRVCVLAVWVDRSMVSRVVVYVEEGLCLPVHAYKVWSSAEEVVIGQCHGYRAVCHMG
jgi:hypothetical protein